MRRWCNSASGSTFTGCWSRRQCPLLAQSGHCLVHCTCLLLTQTGHCIETSQNYLWPLLFKDCFCPLTSRISSTGHSGATEPVHRVTVFASNRSSLRRSVIFFRILVR